MRAAIALSLQGSKHSRNGNLKEKGSSWLTVPEEYSRPPWHRKQDSSRNRHRDRDRRLAGHTAPELSKQEMKQHKRASRPPSGDRAFNHRSLMGHFTLQPQQRGDGLLAHRRAAGIPDSHGVDRPFKALPSLLLLCLAIISRI